MRCSLPGPCQAVEVQDQRHYGCITGYQYLVIVFFLVVFPLNLLIRTFASTTAILYAWRKAGAGSLLSTRFLTSFRMRNSVYVGHALPQALLPCGSSLLGRPTSQACRAGC